MNLRQQLLLRIELRSCPPKETQLRNFPDDRSPTTATPSQQPDSTIDRLTASSATRAATVKQLYGCAFQDESQPVTSHFSKSDEDFEERISCTDCRNLSSRGLCRAHRTAGLTTRELAPDFIELKQRCDGFVKWSGS